MLTTPAIFVLASRRGSTYGTEYASPPQSFVVLVDLLIWFIWFISFPWAKDQPRPLRLTFHLSRLLRFAHEPPGAGSRRPSAPRSVAFRGTLSTAVRAETFWNSFNHGCANRDSSVSSSVPSQDAGWGPRHYCECRGPHSVTSKGRRISAKISCKAFIPVFLFPAQPSLLRSCVQNPKASLWISVISHHEKGILRRHSIK